MPPLLKGILGLLTRFGNFLLQPLRKLGRALMRKYNVFVGAPGWESKDELAARMAPPSSESHEIPSRTNKQKIIRELNAEEQIEQEKFYDALNPNIAKALYIIGQPVLHLNLTLEVRKSFAEAGCPTPNELEKSTAIYALIAKLKIAHEDGKIKDVETCLTGLGLDSNQIQTAIKEMMLFKAKPMPITEFFSKYGYADISAFLFQPEFDEFRIRDVQITCPEKFAQSIADAIVDAIRTGDPKIIRIALDRYGFINLKHGIGRTLSLLKDIGSDHSINLKTVGKDNIAKALAHIKKPIPTSHTHENPQEHYYMMFESDELKRAMYIIQPTLQLTSYTDVIFDQYKNRFVKKEDITMERLLEMTSEFCNAGQLNDVELCLWAVGLTAHQIQTAVKEIVLFSGKQIIPATILFDIAKDIFEREKNQEGYSKACEIIKKLLAESGIKVTCDPKFYKSIARAIIDIIWFKEPSKPEDVRYALERYGFIHITDEVVQKLHKLKTASVEEISKIFATSSKKPGRVIVPGPYAIVLASPKQVGAVAPTPVPHAKPVVAAPPKLSSAARPAAVVPSEPPSTARPPAAAAQKPLSATVRPPAGTLSELMTSLAQREQQRILGPLKAASSMSKEELIGLYLALKKSEEEFKKAFASHLGVIDSRANDLSLTDARAAAEVKAILKPLQALSEKKHFASSEADLKEKSSDDLIGIISAAVTESMKDIDQMDLTTINDALRKALNPPTRTSPYTIAPPISQFIWAYLKEITGAFADAKDPKLKKILETVQKPRQRYYQKKMNPKLMAIILSKVPADKELTFAIPKLAVNEAEDHIEQAIKIINDALEWEPVDDKAIKSYLLQLIPNHLISEKQVVAIVAEVTESKAPSPKH